jgi:hypothetical protein
VTAAGLTGRVTIERTYDDTTKAKRLEVMTFAGRYEESWLLDRSPGQRATSALVALFRQILPSAALALHLRPVRSFVQSADSLFAEALLNGPVS